MEREIDPRSEPNSPSTPESSTPPDAEHLGAGRPGQPQGTTDASPGRTRASGATPPTSEERLGTDRPADAKSDKLPRRGKKTMIQDMVSIIEVR